MGPPESRFHSVPNRALSQITRATCCLSIKKTERMRFALRQCVSAGSDSHVLSPGKFHKTALSNTDREPHPIPFFGEMRVRYQYLRPGEHPFVAEEFRELVAGLFFHSLFVQIEPIAP